MELVDIVDNTGKFIRTQDRGDLVSENEFIESVHIYLLTDDNMIYIQQRSEDKEENPNFWEVVGGGVRSGEDKLSAALRELKEETGIDCFAQNLKPIGQTIADKYLVNAFVYLLIKEENFKPQLEEVKNTMFVDMEDIYELINNDRFYSSSFGLFQKYYEDYNGNFPS